MNNEFEIDLKETGCEIILDNAPAVAWFRWGH
jgi:hypothetical protein